MVFNLDNISDEKITLIIKSGTGECQNFLNKIYSNLLFTLLEKKDNNQEIKDFLQFTLINRINILQQNCINIFINEAMKKDIEYSHDSVNISMNLNSFYFQLSGLIDNLGWYIEYKYKILNIGLDNEKGRKQVGLSKKRNKDFFKELKNKNHDKYKVLLEYQKWINELHDKRDPITHRMPLYVPPSVMLNSEMNFLPIYSLDSDKFFNIVPSIIHDSFKLYKLTITLFEE